MKADSSDAIWVIKKYIDDNPGSKYRANAEEKLKVLYENAGINDSTDFVVCNSISGLNPRGIGNEFNKGTVYAWASVRAPKSESIKFEWLNKDYNILHSERRSVSANLNGYRIYSQYNLSEDGKYEVRLYNSLDTLIGNQTFTIK